jgi:putative acetyltransferase
MITLRPYHKADAPALAALYYHTIHHINKKDYTPEQLNVWAPESARNPERWKQKWEKLPPFVAEINGEPVGFAEFEPNGHIDCFYVHHAHQGKGIGKALMAAILEEATTRNIPKIYAEVSITAQRFFEAQGFQMVRMQEVTLQGIALRNGVMERIV